MDVAGGGGTPAILEIPESKVTPLVIFFQWSNFLPLYKPITFFDRNRPRSCRRSREPLAVVSRSTTVIGNPKSDQIHVIVNIESDFCRLAILFSTIVWIFFEWDMRRPSLLPKVGHRADLGNHSDWGAFRDFVRSLRETVSRGIRCSPVHLLQASLVLFIAAKMHRKVSFPISGNEDILGFSVVFDRYQIFRSKKLETTSGR